MSFNDLLGDIRDGMDGRNKGIPMGFDRLNQHISIRKYTYFLLGGYTGSGKTSLVDDAFVLNPIDWWIRHQRKTDPDFHILYFSMERPRKLKLAKWIARKMFLDNGGHPISLNRVMGWVDHSDNRLSRDEYELFSQYEDYYSRILEKVTFFDGPINPTGIRKIVDGYALENGEIEKVSEFQKIYKPKDPNKITLIIKDTIGLQKGEAIKDKAPLRTKKEIIDKGSEDSQRFRDFYGFTPIDISQFNRDIANPTRIKNGDVEPMLEDFKESGNTQENADIVFSLFDPMRYKVADPSGYDTSKLRDSFGRKKYRSLKILKNSYGSDDIRIGLAFQPEIGLFKEMPKLRDMSEGDYQAILDNTYFLHQ